MIHFGSKIVAEVVFLEADLRRLICLKYTFSRIRLGLDGSQTGTRQDVPPKQICRIKTASLAACKAGRITE